MQKTSFFIVLLSVMFLAGCFRLVYEQPDPIPGVVEQKYYETTNLKILLPDHAAVKEENGTVTLFHTVETFSHTDFCDFKGDSLPTTTFKDFTVKISFTDLTLDKALLKFGGDYLKEFINTDGTIKEQIGFLEKAKIGAFDGYKLSQGVEGCGNNQYFFPVKNGILVIKKDLVPELTNLSTQSDKYKAIPGVILPDKAQQIFEETITNIIIK